MTDPISPNATAEPPAAAPRGWASWMQDERRFWTVAGALLGGCAVLKTLAPPADWPLTQAQLDYSHGFVKRGLAGAIYAALHLSTRRPLTAVFDGELAIFFALLAIFAVRSGMARRFGSPIVVAMFAGSYAVSFVTHILGYTDVVAGAIALALLLVRRPGLRFACAVPAFVAAMLIHENFLLLFAPLVLLSFVLDTAADPTQRRRCLTYAGVLAALAVGLALFTSLQPNMTPEQADAFEDYVDARADFAVRDDFFQVLSAGFSENFEGVQLYGWETWRWWIYMAVSVANLLPMMLILASLGRLVLRAAPLAETGLFSRRVVTLAAMAAALSPLLLHLIGLDGVRWNTWAAVDGFLALGLVCRYLPGQPLPLSPARRNAIVLAIALGMASGHGLFNGADVNAFPFFPKALKGFVLRHDKPLPGF